MTLIRAILTYRSPDPRHMRNLMNAIFNAVSDHSIYIANPDTNLILHSTDVVKTMRILEPMTCHKVDQELLYQIQKDIMKEQKLITHDKRGIDSNHYV